MSDVDTGDEECEEVYDEDLLKDLNNQIRDIELASILQMRLQFMEALTEYPIFSFIHDITPKYKFICIKTTLNADGEILSSLKYEYFLFEFQ